MFIYTNNNLIIIHIDIYACVPRSKSECHQHGKSIHATHIYMQCPV